LDGERLVHRLVVTAEATPSVSAAAPGGMIARTSAPIVGG